jgi:sn-glycerol 3-phosphate transport system permease protein
LSDARTTTTTVIDGGAVAVRPRPTVTVLQAETERPRRRVDWNTILVHAALLVAVALVAFPLYYAFVISTQALDEVIQKPPRLLPSAYALENYVEAWRRSGMGRLLLNSAVVAVGVAVGKIAISMLSAFAIVYFRFRGASVVFWLIFLTLMLPIPVRILPTYEVVGNIGWLNTYAGLTVPLMASATATFLFRQFYMTVPNELAEAAQMDGAGPLRFLWSFLLPLSWANIAALFVVLFIYGWNEYFWPLLITNTEEMRTVVIGLERLIPRSGTELPTWNLIMAGAMMALVPPVAVILFMQRWFVKGLIESEK